ncbi:MAG: hypothetical protein ACLR0U_20620 [Enterocloster clostridioformis]
MELLVLPAVEDENLRNLSRDELPQSAAGKTTGRATEPKFIPKARRPESIWQTAWKPR